jgi:SAM-dependent methyltransferase
MRDDALDTMLALDERHWWYRGRRRVIRAELDRLALPQGARILDAGCGSGRTLDELARYGTAFGLDESPAAIAAAHRRGHRRVVRGSVERLPYPDSSFDLVTCLDVVEHTPDDRRTLLELRRVTRPGGHLLLTVPAYQALWSSHDVANRHYRRYRRGTLRRAARTAGWELVRDGHFNSLLLAPAAVVRLAERVRRNPPARSSDLTLTPPLLDRVLELPLALEAALIRRGTQLPAGLSVIALLRNPGGVVPAPAGVPDAVVDGRHEVPVAGAAERDAAPVAGAAERDAAGAGAGARVPALLRAMIRPS